MSNEGESSILGMLTHLAAEVATLRNEVALQGEKLDRMDGRTDRLDVQLALVEKRPGLRDAGMGQVETT